MRYSLVSLFKFFFQSESKPRTMNPDTFLSIVDSNHSMSTTDFLRDVMLLAVLFPSLDPKEFLNRFMVKSITQCKVTGPRHEFIVVQLIDTHCESQTHLMYLERTASDNHPPADYLKNIPDNAVILEELMDTLRKFTPKSVSPSTSHVIDSSDSTTASSRNDPSIGSFFDNCSFLSTDASHASSQSISKVYSADDRWTGGKQAPFYAPGALNVRQISPASLSLFDLAVLADTVHIHDSLYSIFKSHCFWFVNIICDVIEKEYDCSITSTTAARISSDDIYIPPNNFLPNLAGSWMGVQVSKVEAAVVSTMASKFQTHLEEKLEEGSFLFFFFSILKLANSQTQMEKNWDGFRQAKQAKARAEASEAREQALQAREQASQGREQALLARERALLTREHALQGRERIKLDSF